jgi:hypothetical protein
VLDFTVHTQALQRPYSRTFQSAHKSYRFRNLKPTLGIQLHRADPAGATTVPPESDEKPTAGQSPHGTAESGRFPSLRMRTSAKSSSKRIPARKQRIRPASGTLRAHFHAAGQGMRSCMQTFTHPGGAR